jgi:hypothetical protein
MKVRMGRREREEAKEILVETVFRTRIFYLFLRNFPAQKIDI